MVLHLIAPVDLFLSKADPNFFHKLLLTTVYDDSARYVVPAAISFSIIQLY